MVSFIFPVSLSLATGSGDLTPPGSIVEVLKDLLFKVVDNPVNALINANYIGILAWAVLLGVALKGAGDPTKNLLTQFSDAVSQIVRWVIQLAPFGIMGLVFDTITANGISSLLDYGKLLLVLIGCMLFMALVVNPLIVYLNIRRNPYPLVISCLKESGITAFFTRSSAANIPVNMRLCEKLGLDKNTYSVSIPLGATINMAGAAVTISVLTLAAVHTLGIRGFWHGAYSQRTVGNVCRRRLRRGRRFAAPRTFGLQLVWYFERYCDAGRWCRLHHRRIAGLFRNGAEFIFRCAVHRDGGICQKTQRGHENDGNISGQKSRSLGAPAFLLT